MTYDQALSTVTEFYELLREAERRRALKDLSYLSKFVLGKKYLLENNFDHHHLGLAKRLQHLIETRLERDPTIHATEWPRGTFKTTIVVHDTVVWAMLRWPDIRILLTSFKGENAQNRLVEIKATFEDAYFQYLFGKRYNERSRWSSTQLALLRGKEFKEPTLDYGGPEMDKVGNHYDMIVGDDLQTEDNSLSWEQIEKVRRYTKNCLSLLNKNGVFIHALTRWAFNDVGAMFEEWNEISDREFRAKEVEISKFSVYKLDDLGKLTDDIEFPTIFTRDKLNGLRAKQGPFLFSCNYLLNPTSDATAVFKNDWLRFRQFTLGDLKLPKVYMALDPAGAGGYEKADYTSIAVAAITPEFDIFALDLVRARMTHREILEKLFELNERWHPATIGVEAVFKQRQLYFWLKQEALAHGRFLPFTELKTSNRQKDARIKALTPHVEAGKFIIKEDMPNRAYLVDEMLRYPKGAHDDCIDAFAYMTEFMSAPIEAQPEEYWRDPKWRDKWPEEKGAPPTRADVRAERYFADRARKRRRYVPLSRV
jgi:predicted phage terminase large subunit-like protein